MVWGIMLCLFSTMHCGDVASIYQLLAFILGFQLELKCRGECFSKLFAVVFGECELKSEMTTESKELLSPATD